MARHIDADALKDALEMDGFKSPYVARMIDACPTVGDAKHGDWIMVSSDGTFGVCKACNRSDHIDPLATHCRYCGAKMDGKADANDA